MYPVDVQQSRERDELVLANLLADLTRFLDHALIIKVVEGVNITVQQISLGLQESCQFLGMLGLDEQVPSSTSHFTRLHLKHFVHPLRTFFHLVMRFHVIEAHLVNWSL